MERKSDKSVLLSHEEWRLIVLMREAQKGYFKGKQSYMLENAKSYEKKVDRLIEGQLTMEVNE